MKENFPVPGNVFFGRTMFYDSATALAILVTNNRGRMSQQVKKFPDAQAALAWCLEHRVSFCYVATPDPKQN